LQRLSPHFYRDGLLQHTRAVSHTGAPLQQSARAFARRSSTLFSLRQTAAAPRCSAGPRCSIYSYHGRPLQHRGFSPQRTAAANRCSISVRYIIFLTPAHRYSRLLQRIRAGAAVDGCSILSSGQRCSKLLQHSGWALAGSLSAGWLAGSSSNTLTVADRCSTRARAFSNAGVVCCSTCENSRVAPGES